MKNNLIIILIVLSFQQFTHAQRWNLEKRHSIDLIAGAEISSLHLAPSEASLDQFTKIRKRTKSQMLNPTFRIGLDYNYALSEKVFIKTGGRILTTGYHSEEFDTFNAIEKDQIRKYKQKEIQQSFDYNYKFLEIPLQARYVYSRNRCKSYIEGGLAGLLYMESRIMVADDSPEFSRDYVPLEEEVTPFHLHAVLTVGGEFWITKDFPAFIQMSARAQITEFINDGIAETTQGLGIKTGVRYLF